MQILLFELLGLENDRRRQKMPDEAEMIPPDPRADAEREERIRKRAYQLWEEDGSPEGRRVRKIGIALGSL